MVEINESEVEEWIRDDPDPVTVKELSDLLGRSRAGDQEAREDLADRFSGMLTFGTAGLRGHLGGGPNRMNRAVVFRAARGLGNFLHRRLPDGYTVVIGFDARRGSRTFATDTASIIEACHGHALLFDGPLPTPLTSFALRRFDFDAAVMVTASHNPAEDNGYKVFLGGRVVRDSGRGSQIVPPLDSEILAEIQLVQSASTVPRAESGWTLIGPQVAESYLDRIVSKTPRGPRDLRIVFTPIHGVGGWTGVEALRRCGFSDVHVVAEQFEPDPEFRTVRLPNPEEKGTLDLALDRARALDADILLATDPDADRCAVAVPDPLCAAGWRRLSGDEVGGLLADQILKEQDSRPAASAERRVTANSIVSSRLLEQISHHYGVGYQQTLTGLKWVSRVPGLVLGYEEALGYCVDPDAVHDKDGISAACRIAVLAAQEKSSGRSLLDSLDDLALRFGLFLDEQVNIRYEGRSGSEAVMERLRSQPPSLIAGAKVVEITDYSIGVGGLPPTNAVKLLTVGNDRVVMRPSGTEAKLKCYIEVVAEVDGAVPQVRERARRRAERIAEEFRFLMGA